MASSETYLRIQKNKQRRTPRVGGGAANGRNTTRQHVNRETHTNPRDKNARHFLARRHIQLNHVIPRKLQQTKEWFFSPPRLFPHATRPPPLLDRLRPRQKTAENALASCLAIVHHVTFHGQDEVNETHEGFLARSWGGGGRRLLSVREKDPAMYATRISDTQRLQIVAGLAPRFSRARETSMPAHCRRHPERGFSSRVVPPKIG